MQIFRKYPPSSFRKLSNAPDVIKLCGCSRNSYYKYKREIKTTA